MLLVVMVVVSCLRQCRSTLVFLVLEPGRTRRVGCLLVLLCELQNVDAATERCFMRSVKKLGHICFGGVHSNRLYQQQFWIIRNKVIKPIILCIVQYQYLFSLLPSAVSFVVVVCLFLNLFCVCI